ncbi:MAG: DUF3696 domain-containing protein [Chitinophagales bacterium]|jgi:predicted ATPase|nr:DUF3696 domain-containing protein [Sphingobacteriales bacterium]
MVSQINFKNFKLFKNWQTLEIKPITILIGKNNSGKTAVLKLPTMIGESLRGNFSEPISLNSKVNIGKKYDELFYSQDILADTLDFEILDKFEKIKISLNGVYKSGNIEIKSYNFNDENIKITKSNIKGFKYSKLKHLNLNFDYIEAFREYPKDGFTTDFYGKIDTIGISGINAFKLLSLHRKENNSLIISKISNWFKENFEGWGLEVKPFTISSSTEGFDFVLSNDKIKNINILNTGSGIRQVLPLIVRSYMPVEEETLIIIEEPESHLHPAAHGNLAQRFVESYLEDYNKRYLIETHSQNFVLRMRRLVAEGILNPDDLAIYYVDYDEEEFASNLKRIEVDEIGRVSFWPEGIFSETLDETIGIRTAQIDRQ